MNQSQAIRLNTPAFGGKVLDNSLLLNMFLKSAQARAFRIARIATRNNEDALDLVQDAMFKLAEKYSYHPESEWPPLFYRILHSRINDWHRRTSVRNRFRGWFGVSEDDAEDPIQTAPDLNGATPESTLVNNESMEKLQKALGALPLRQQQAFLMRAWEGLDVKQTAITMSCAEGSVKTHYSRAVHNLREQLGEHWP